jgi:molybdopterin converting factor small subunit
MEMAPSIQVRIPGPLRTYCGGASQLLLQAVTVREALAELERRNPRLYGNVCDETGAVRRHINVFVNSSDIRDCEGFDTPLKSGDQLIILPAVSGG